MEQFDIQLDGELVLQDDLIMKIFSKLPFPHILKVKCLSKRWYSLLMSDCSEAKAFQEVVNAEASSWPSFTPVLISYDELEGYDITVKKWLGLGFPSLAKSVLVDWVIDWIRDSGKTVFSAGPMMCWFGARNVIERTQRIVVINMITGTFGAFSSPALASRHQRWLLHHQVFHATRNGFIILLMYENLQGNNFELLLQVYDSSKASWETNCVTLRAIRRSTCSGIVCRKMLDDCKLFSVFNNRFSLIFGYYDVFSKQWIQIQSRDITARYLSTLNIQLRHFVCCGTRRFIVGCENNGRRGEFWNYRLHLFEFEETSGAVSRVEPEFGFSLDSQTCSIDFCSSDQDHIYICCDRYEYGDVDMYVFRILDREWSTHSVPREGFQWVHNSFSPGLCPFLNPSTLP